MKKSLAALAVVVVAVAGISGIATAQSTASSKNIVQTAVAAGKFKTLVALVKQAGLAGTLSAPGNLTVFAPTDKAFANLKKSNPDLFAKVASDKKLLQAVLTYHVVGKRIPAAAATAAAKKGLKVKTVQGERIALSFKNGRIVLNGTARVVIPDVNASNGVIHAINAVLVPPSLLQAPAPAPTKSIVEIAVGNPDFSTLVSLVQKAGLVEAISAAGPFTVFAPTNEAFDKLAKAAPATYAAVLADPKLLAKVLTYHVVSGAIKSPQAIDVAKQNGSVTPLEGEPISLSIKDGKLTLNGSSTVVTADILATNGVIHVIDTVIVPPSLLG
jgi:transforming growth factor-beta-induced protein